MDIGKIWTIYTNIKIGEIMSNNLFQIGGKVKGDYFIGRKNLVEDFRRIFLEYENRAAKSIVGLTRIGKSSFIDNVFNNISNDILFIYENLNEWSSYLELWQDICYNIKKFLENKDKNIFSNNLLKEYFYLVEQSDIVWIKLNRAIKSIFEYLSDKNIKTILIMDEFDNAKSIFNEGTKHFELFRTIFSDSKYNVSAITISRRSLNMIEGTTYQGSTFHGVLDPIYFKGFNKEDIDIYFSKFDKIDLKLTEEHKKDIIYYAGNSPYLLSILGYYIVETVRNCKISFNNNFSIDEIFLNKCNSINDYYRDCIKHLERDGDLKRIIPFIIGPNIGVTKSDKEELVNLGYLRDENGELVLISKYFTIFLYAATINIDIWNNIIQFEKQIKAIINNEIIELINNYKVAGNDISSIQRNLLSKVKGINNSEICKYKNIIEKTKKNFNVDSTYFDAMSLGNSCKIITECWSNIFCKYFNNEPLPKWEDKFKKCIMARNPIAHAHEEYLTIDDKKEVDKYCLDIFNIINKSGITMNIHSKNRIIDEASKYIN